MSTNYYAKIAVTADSDLTQEITLHLGKTGSGCQVDGNLFSSFDAMVLFLKGVETNTTIFDEYGSVYTIDEFADLFYSYDKVKRANQYNYVSKHNPEYMHQYDLDSEGFTMSKGVWS